MCIYFEKNYNKSVRKQLATVLAIVHILLYYIDKVGLRRLPLSLSLSLLSNSLTLKRKIMSFIPWFHNDNIDLVRSVILTGESESLGWWWCYICECYLRLQLIGRSRLNCTAGDVRVIWWFLWQGLAWIWWIKYFISNKQGRQSLI